ncbi:hypothetical protein KM043_010886 [Ampulex compressa]|nr:hypothetical protein KM043_010886 [Ampulex compressa]
MASRISLKLTHDRSYEHHGPTALYLAFIRLDAKYPYEIGLVALRGSNRVRCHDDTLGISTCVSRVSSETGNLVSRTETASTRHDHEEQRCFGTIIRQANGLRR